MKKDQANIYLPDQTNSTQMITDEKTKTPHFQIRLGQTQPHTSQKGDGRVGVGGRSGRMGDGWVGLWGEWGKTSPICHHPICHLATTHLPPGHHPISVTWPPPHLPPGHHPIYHHTTPSATYTQCTSSDSAREMDAHMCMYYIYLLM